MSEKKITKREKFTMLMNIPGVAENPMLMEFIEHEMELLAKKNAADRTNKTKTPQQKLNDSIKDAIAENMERDKLYTITELMKSIPACADLTNQKVNSLVYQMIAPEDGRVVRVEDKRKAYFKLA